MCTYTLQYRVGTLVALGWPVEARQAEEAIQFVGQTIQNLGIGDKRYYKSSCWIDTCLSNMWKHWKTEDPPPERVKPIPMSILFKAQELANADNSLASKATAWIMWTMSFSCANRVRCARHDKNAPSSVCKTSPSSGTQSSLTYSRPPSQPCKGLLTSILCSQVGRIIIATRRLNRRARGTHLRP